MADVFDFYVYDDRSIRFAIAEPIMLEDKDVTQFRFRIPKSLNGFDMSDWEWWFIFVNPKGTKYTTLLELTDDEDEPGEYSVATYTVGYGFSGIVGTVRFSIEALNVSGEEIVNEWHTKTYSTAIIDTLQGLRAIIPEPDGQVSTGITEEVKQALLQIARKVAYIDEHGQTYYDALYNALYAITAVILTPKSIFLTSIGATSQLSARTVPEGGTVAWSSSNTNVATVDQNGLVTAIALGSATITATSGGKSGTCSVLVAEATLTEISAVYTPSGTVYESDSLDSLKSDLVVTAHWSNGTTSTVPSADYTLSGTLAVGTDTITVSYGGMTTTFEVTVVGLTGITATYTQSGTVYTIDSLDSLKSDLVVTANYSDSTSETVTDYTISGTLTEGTSTVTVSFEGLTTTFTVDCTVKGWLYHFNESIESSGEDDFNLVGTGVYDTGLFDKKCYKHFTPTSGTASTDTQYGLYAKNLTEVLDYGHDFTVSCWMATQKNGYCHLYDQTIARGNTYPSNRYFSEVTKINQDWGNLSHGQSTNNNAGILIFMGTQSNNNFLAVRLANSELTASSYVGINIPSSVDTRDWHHYALTRKGDKVRMFFDGEILWEATASESTIYDSQQCAISTNFNTSTNDIQQMPNGEKLQDLYIAPFCKWEADFDTSAITY